MLKFVKHNLETISGVEIYPIISLTIFFTAFIFFLMIIVAKKSTRIRIYKQLRKKLRKL